MAMDPRTQDPEFDQLEDLRNETDIALGDRGDLIQMLNTVLTAFPTFTAPVYNNRVIRGDPRPDDGRITPDQAFGLMVGLEPQVQTIVADYVHAHACELFPDKIIPTTGKDDTQK
jgi:hypothetical protein